MSLEFLDTFNNLNEPMGKIKARTLIHKDGDWHRTSQVWVVNENKEVLCNLRSPNKDLFAGYWDLSVGGHVVTGDTYENTAVKELYEELGITVESSELALICDEKVEGVDAEKNLIDREHARLYLYFTNKSVNEIRFQTEEIERIEFFFD